MEFPRTVDEITPEWLTQVLRASGAITDTSIVSFSPAEIGVGRGAGGRHQPDLSITETVPFC